MIAKILWRLAICCLLLPSLSWADAGELYGRIVALDENDQTQPLKGVPISIAAGGVRMSVS